VTILVSDTSVLIDLERGQLLDSCFTLPHEFAVPDLLYRRELADYGGPALVARGLRVEELTSEELASAQVVRTKRAKLSLPDAYAYALARNRNWTLLTGDAQLRAAAHDAQIDFFGVLWVCDQIVETGAIASAVVAVGLEAIAAHPRCRLPRGEIAIRLERYRNG
jgi:predicted nucleic acid-binding protein